MTPPAAPAVQPDLESRRERLLRTIGAVGPAADLVSLLEQVDGALQRFQVGHFEECVVCHEPLGEELERHPLGRYCLCELDGDQVRLLEQDLELAWSIQAGLLPTQGLGVPGWQSHYRYLPAGPVSGDVVDVVCGRDGTLHFLLGDVSGKGVSAALLMAHLGATYRSLVRAGVPLDQLVSRLNTELVRRTDARRYVTLVAGVARPDGTLELVNAGHVPPLLVGGGEVTTISASGPPVGLFAESTYSVERLRAIPGQSLLLYTDGITESTDASGRELGVDGLARLSRWWTSAEPRALAASTLSAVTAFRDGAAQSDDETVLVIRRG